MQHNCIICRRTATKRYLVQWDISGAQTGGQYCICDKTHCYNVLYSLVDDHHCWIGSTSFTIELISDHDDQNDDPFGV